MPGRGVVADRPPTDGRAPEGVADVAHPAEGAAVPAREGVVVPAREGAVVPAGEEPAVAPGEGAAADDDEQTPAQKHIAYALSSSID